MAKKSLLAAAFIEPMECMPVTTIPEGPGWWGEVKLDGYRLQAVKHGGDTTLYSRRGNVLNAKFQSVADALKKLPDDTILDGEIVALDDKGRSDFNLIQNFRSAAARIHYYAFDVLMHKGMLLTSLPLSERRVILQKITPLNHHVTLSPVDHSSSHLLSFVKANGLEGIVAKRMDSIYEPGKRTGLWTKYRINLGQEFVIGGYTPGSYGFDAIIVGFYKGKDLLFAARVRAGFIPATRREVFKELGHLSIQHCPFANLPEKTAGRFGQGITAEKMNECIWVKPGAVVRIDFLEWTGASKLRHPKFISMRDDKDPQQIVREN